MGQIWNVDHIELARIQEENQRFELLPTLELKVGHNSELVSLVRAVVTDDQDPQWFAQVCVRYSDVYLLKMGIVQCGVKLEW